LTIEIPPETLARFGILKRSLAWKSAYAHSMTRVVMAKIAEAVAEQCDLTDAKIQEFAHAMVV
jgi:hypothetical protein